MSGYGKILLVEDDEQLAIVVRDSLVDAGYECIHAVDGLAGLQTGLDAAFDLAILDVNLPSLCGLDVCRELKRAQPGLSVMMLTARAEEVDIISGLETGADEYLTKPISPAVLIARVRARLREKQRLQRSVGAATSAEPQTGEATIIEIGNLRIDRLGTRLHSCGKEIELTAGEFNFIEFLASNAGRSFERQELLEAVWGTDNHNYWPNVTVMVSRLRSKLAHDPLVDKYLITVRGRGYRFAKPEELAE